MRNTVREILWPCSAAKRSLFTFLTLLCPLSAYLFLPEFAAATTRDVEQLSGLSLSELLEVRVASGFLENELRVGSSVSQVSEDQWRRQGARRTFDAIEHVPGVYVSDYINGQSIPSFRGFSDSNQYNSFLLLLDGMPLNNYSSGAGTYGTPNFALGNLRSIEVIRGPGSAVYGANAFQGVVAMNTWSSEEDRYEAWGEAGNHGYWQANGRIRQSLGEHAQLTAMISGSGLEDAEIVEKFHPSPGADLVTATVTGEHTNVTATAKLAIEDFELAFYYSENDTKDSFGVGELAGVFPNGNHSDGLAKMGALKLSYLAKLASGWEIDSTAYHIRDELFGSFGLVNVGGPPEPPSLDWDSKDRRTGINILAKKPYLQSKTQLLFGYTFDFMEVDRFGANVTGAPPTVEDESRKLNGLMGQVEHRFLDDQLQLILGLRYDHYSDFGDHFSPRVAVIYHPLENSALKFMYGNAYRAPALNEQVTSGLIKGGGEALGPETVDTFELVWMQSDGGWRYSVSTYYSMVKDGINITISNEPGFFFEYRNNADFESYGIELDGSYRIEKWELFGNLSYNQSKQTGPIEIEEIFSAYPDYILNFGITYQPVPEWTITLNQLVHEGRETLVVPLTSPSYENTGPLPTRARTDLHLGWQPWGPEKDHELYFYVRDLFDNADIQSSMSPVENGNGTAGRQFALGLRLGF